MKYIHKNNHDYDDEIYVSLYDLLNVVYDANENIQNVYDCDDDEVEYFHDDYDDYDDDDVLADRIHHDDDDFDDQQIHLLHGHFRGRHCDYVEA